MNKILKAELLKIKKNKLIILLSIGVLALVSILYIWEAFLGNEQIRQVSLQESSKAGSFGLIMFTNLIRRVWGILVGFSIMNVELIENRSDFFVQNTSRYKMWISKIIVLSILSAIMTILAYAIPFIIATTINGGLIIGVSLSNILIELIAVWLMAIGCAFLGMLFGLFLNDIMIVAVLIGTLEFFTNIYPSIVIDIWNRMDGYIYLSFLLKPIKQQLQGLDNFYVSIYETMPDVQGVIIWLVIIILYATLGIFSFKKFDL